MVSSPSNELSNPLDQATLFRPRNGKVCSTKSNTRRQSLTDFHRPGQLLDPRLRTAYVLNEFPHSLFRRLRIVPAQSRRWGPETARGLVAPSPRPYPAIPALPFLCALSE